MTGSARDHAAFLPPALDALPLPVFLDRLGEVAWCVGGDGRCTWAGPRWKLSTGLAAASSRDLGWLDAVRKEDRPPLLPDCFFRP